mmetsp:Transcript_64811/g.180106  ORF Transcript_64811/g.180106 Transcript_64811/m.180106 type:complete len:101 (-) Transcript_64811:147-449(-)
MRQNADYRAAFVPFMMTGGQTPATWDEYCDIMAQEGTYVEGYEIEAAVMAFRLIITKIGINEGHRIVFQPPDDVEAAGRAWLVHYDAPGGAAHYRAFEWC